MVARFVRDEEAVGSNPATPTNDLPQFPHLGEVIFSAPAVRVSTVARGGQKSRKGAEGAVPNPADT